MYFHVDLIGRVCLAHKYLKFLNILSNNNMYHIHIGQRLNTINYKHWEILKQLTTLQLLYLVLSAVATIHGTSWIHGIHGTFRYFTLGLISRNINIYTYFFHFSQKYYLVEHNILVACFSFIGKSLNGKFSFSRFVLCHNGIIYFTNFDDGHSMYPLFYWRDIYFSWIYQIQSMQNNMYYNILEVRFSIMCWRHLFQNITTTPFGMADTSLWLRVQAALLKDPGFIPSTQMSAFRRL